LTSAIYVSVITKFVASRIYSPFDINIKYIEHFRISLWYWTLLYL